MGNQEVTTMFYTFISAMTCSNPKDNIYFVSPCFSKFIQTIGLKVDECGAKLRFVVCSRSILCFIILHQVYVLSVKIYS